MAQGREPGTLIDGFRLEEKIHQGSMAEIWRVRRDRAPLPMVMKIPSFRDGDDPAAIVGFEVEQMILPTLSGVHVPRFLAAGDWSVQPYIVMEQIGGPSLRSRLDDAPCGAEEVASIGARVAAALHDLHGQQVIHLDVKPSNVMFRENGEAVLIDFGLSRHDRLPDLLAEQFRIPMGTGPYISPEQIRQIRNDPRSDLFSLGVVLYYLATGQRPFGNPTSVRGLRQRLYRDPVPPSARNPQCPPWLQEVILRCLEVSPARRYDTAAHLAFQFQHPEQVALTARARRTARDGILTVARRRFRLIGEEPDLRQSAAVQLSKAPIVAVAIDLTQGSEALAEALLLTTRRVLQTEPGARLACLTVLRTPRLGIETSVDGEGHSLRMRLLVELQHWARPLGLGVGRITHHVLEAPDPAAAIVEFAGSNHVDHIVIGSRGSSTLRRYLGSVSSQVVAQAVCTVTVVKTPPEREGETSGEDSPAPEPSGGPRAPG
jgi:nucleotide-binding universal stress UspA family protein